jgi:acyl-coenzyme A thioesterase PaaI-like protein
MISIIYLMHYYRRMQRPSELRADGRFVVNESRQRFVGSAPAPDERLTEVGRRPVALCGACRRLGHCRMGVDSESMDDAGVVSYHLRCGRENEGGLNVAHGGWTAGVLDELVGHVAVLNDQLAVTGQLNVTFVRPVPVEQPLTARAWRDAKRGSRWFVTAVLCLEAGGAELARAEGILVERDPGHFARHQEWLDRQLRESGHGA